MIKINRERLTQKVESFCENNCDGCAHCGKKHCIHQLVAEVLEQNPDLITGLPQNTEQIPLPVKTTWTLKPEFQQFCKDHDIPMSFELPVEPQQRKEYYDCKTEPDYSKVPVGAVVEINNFQYAGIIDQIESNCMCLTISSHSSNRFYIPFIDIKSLTILKLPENTK